MFGATLTVAIGLVLVYVLFAVFESTITEVISATFKLRSAALETSIAQLLEDPPTLAAAPGGGAGAAAQSAGPTPPRPLFAMFRPPNRPRAGENFSVAGNTAPAATAVQPAALKRQIGQPLAYTAVFNHPLVAGTQRANRPAYVSSENFTSALLFALRGVGTGSLFSDFADEVAILPEGSLKSTLATLVRDAQGDLAALRAGIARWYDSSMDRLSGDYKRFTQWIAFWIGLVLAVACNVDTVRMVQRLYAEPALQSSMSKAAESYVAQAREPAAAKASQPETVAAKVAGVGQAENLLMNTAPVGWTAAPGSSLGWAIAILGWVVTAIAGVLGASFWFELLQKLVNIRNTGPKPASTTA